jgi:flagellar biosynthesis/type III secretory pathway chaperone
VKQVTIQPLLELLRKLTELNRQLLELAKNQTEALVKNDFELLNSSVFKANKIVRAIAKLEQSRVQIIGEYLLSRAFNPDPRITVSDLIKIIFNAKEKKALMDSQNELMESVQSLKRVNQHNQRLLQLSSPYIHETLELMAGPPEDEIFYHNPSVQGTGTMPFRSFDSRA